MANLSKLEKIDIVLEAMDAFMDEKSIKKACKYKEGSAARRLWIETYEEIQNEDRPPEEINIPRLKHCRLPDEDLFDIEQMELWGKDLI
jgi:hypothetical protein